MTVTGVTTADMSSLRIETFRNLKTYFAKCRMNEKKNLMASQGRIFERKIRLAVLKGNTNLSAQMFERVVWRILA